MRIASTVRDPRGPKNCEGSGYHNSEHPLMNDDSRRYISIVGGGYYYLGF